MNRLRRRPTTQSDPNQASRYQRFNLTENPFPTEPVNKDSSDRRINGCIYETEIRTREYEQIERAFLKVPQTDLNHLRLGYICDTSYIGRGNGKSAFLINLMNKINSEYCMDISNDKNKCFCLYVTPEPGGRTKTFDSFVDLLYDSISQSRIIETCLALLRLEALEVEFPTVDIADGNETELVDHLNSESWLKEKGIDPSVLMRAIASNAFLQNLPADFPLLHGHTSIFQPFVVANAFHDYYRHQLKKGQERLDFLFTHMVQFFLASGFNGAYVFVDDFERVPDFQSGRQRKDFALELRGCLFDGPYANARYGYYNILLVLHAGVPQLISDAWRLSGLENRYPIAPKVESKHMIRFEKLDRQHVFLLLKKYLNAYRFTSQSVDELSPFVPNAISLIAEKCEYNAGKILRSCWDLLEKAAEDPGRDNIDESFVKANVETHVNERQDEGPAIEDPSATDLMRKAIQGD